ncbi:hypothetical protein Z043_108794, partial [Scleropages formosus]
MHLLLRFPADSVLRLLAPHTLEKEEGKALGCTVTVARFTGVEQSWRGEQERVTWPLVMGMVTLNFSAMAASRQVLPTPVAPLDRSKKVPHCSTLGKRASENNQQECHIIQNHSPIRPGSCCLQASPSVCLHQRWQEHLQSQPGPPNMASI